MVSKNIGRATNGDGRRKCRSWIESFVEHTKNIESVEIWRKWAAISLIAAVAQRKVWIVTSGILYPNLYTFLVGPAGTGKSQAIHAALEFLDGWDDIKIGATSMTMASLTDTLSEANRVIPVYNGSPALEYQALYVAPDEFSALMDKYDTAIMSGLTTLYDCKPYSQSRRVNDINIKMKKPIVNMLTGVTPAFLVATMPPMAWEQGFSSRILMIWGDKAPFTDIFANAKRALPAEMTYDLHTIDGLVGEFRHTEDYRTFMLELREKGIHPIPAHPKLGGYNNRRWAHLCKLTMVASLDRSNDLLLDAIDIKTALGWLLEAEASIGGIFTSAASGDAQVIAEIEHFVACHGDGLPEQRIKRFVSDRVSIQNVQQVMSVMKDSGRLIEVGPGIFRAKIFPKD